MGVWGVGSFENDTALDWLSKLYESKDFALVHDALNGDFKTAQPYVVRRAIAAADLVACSLGHPPPEPSRRGLVEWAREHSDAFTSELLHLAQQTVASIKVDSTLRDALTDENGVVSAEWLNSMADLERRLHSQPEPA